MKCLFVQQSKKVVLGIAFASIHPWVNSKLDIDESERALACSLEEIVIIHRQHKDGYKILTRLFCFVFLNYWELISGLLHFSLAKILILRCAKRNKIC